MNDPRTTLAGQEPVNGIHCWTVKVHASDELSGTPIEVTAWLDPTHDYLPSQIVVQREDIREHVWKWTIPSFAATEDHQTLRWLPKTADLHLHNAILRMTVHSVHLNQALHFSIFKPDLSQGAMVADLTSATPMRVNFVGNRAALGRRVDELATRSRSSPTPKSVPADISATPGEPPSWQLLAWLSASSLAVALFMWWRTSR